MPNWIEYKAEGDDYVPVDKWGHDHWSTLAYLETIVTDHKGVIDNRRMRCNSRLHREFTNIGPFGDVIDGRHPTQLKKGEIENHDDWSCLEDAVKAGFIRAYFQEKHHKIYGGSIAKVEFTDEGFKIASDLRNHKAKGGTFRDYSINPKVLERKIVWDKK